MDAFETTAHQVERLHNLGRHVICYVNAGAWERFRGDKDKFPDSVLGRALDGWPGERWLDIRRIGVLGPIMKARIARCARKGFDAVEPDNIDGYQNKSGFSLSGSDQLRYNRWFARQAHRKGMSIALKNDLGQVKALVPDFDFAIVEECFQYRECGKAVPFIARRQGRARGRVQARPLGLLLEGPGPRLQLDEEAPLARALAPRL